MKYRKLLTFFAVSMLLAFTASAQTTVTSSTTTMSTGTYQVTEDVTISNRITISGDVTLILGEGTTLTASKGIAVHQGNSLTIEGDGSLNAYNEVYSDAAIGGSKSSPNAGTITINGGNIFARSYKYPKNGVQSAAIGGGYFYDYDYANNIDKSIGGNGTIIINGGTIHTLVSFGGAACFFRRCCLDRRFKGR